MDPVRTFELFLLRVVGLGATFGYVVSVFKPLYLPKLVQDRPYTIFIGLSLLINLLNSLVIYPKFRDPLRNLPTIPGVSDTCPTDTPSKVALREKPLLTGQIFRRETEDKLCMSRLEERLYSDGWNKDPTLN